ncbi:mannosyltransferase family protein, partial [Streptomyces sp. NPDC054840]
MPVSAPRRPVERPDSPTTWPSVHETGRRPRRSLPALLRLGPGEREVVWLYLLTRVGIWATAGAVGWLFPADGAAR